MKTSNLKLAAIAAGLALTAGCAKKAPEQLPPPPMESGTTAPTGETTGTVGQGVVPGSRADFMQKVSSDRVHFITDSYSLDGEARSILDTQATWLQANPSVNVTIEGHADERGTREYNQALGERRASATRDFLVSQGVPTSRLVVTSWGKERPVALGSNEEAWAQNRRAVTVVIR